MRIKYVFALFACACALLCALVGCGSSGGQVQSWEHKAFAGTWNLVEMSDGGDVTGTDELKLMNSLGMQVTLTLGTDSKLTLDTLGKQSEGTWKAESETEGTATIEDQEIALQIAEGRLVMEQGGDKLVFDKMPDETASEEGGGSESSASAASAASSGASSSASSASSASSSSASSASASASSASSASEKGSR